MVSPNHPNTTHFRYRRHQRDGNSQEPHSYSFLCPGLKRCWGARSVGTRELETFPWAVFWPWLTSTETGSSTTVCWGFQPLSAEYGNMFWGKQFRQQWQSTSSSGCKGDCSHCLFFCITYAGTNSRFMENYKVWVAFLPSLSLSQTLMIYVQTCHPNQ